MDESWNFHGYIALPLETYGRKYIGKTFLSADEIECGEFVDAMLLILSTTHNDLNKFSGFIEQSKAYRGLSANNIPSDISKALFDDFEEAIRCYENQKEVFQK